MVLIRKVGYGPARNLNISATHTHMIVNLVRACMCECMYTRAHDSLWRRRNIYYFVHRPAEVESLRVGAGKGSRAANCPPSYPPYTLPHTNVVTHCSSFSLQLILSYFFSHSSTLSRLTRLCRLTAPASKALDYLPLISARVAHLLPRLLRLPRTRPPSFLPYFCLPSFAGILSF